MGNISIYNQKTDTTYTVSFDLRNTYLNEELGAITGEPDFYLDITTTMKKPSGASFGHNLVRTLDDVPPGILSAANDFSDLCNKYVEYFINEAELIQSSSSSSSEGYSSSSSSSSEGYSSSSSSSSSSLNGPH